MSEPAKDDKAMNGWPDPDRLGVPHSPEGISWHWIEWPHKDEMAPVQWDGDGWFDQGKRFWPVEVPLGWKYIGPCFTPEDLLAAIDEAVEARIDALIDLSPGVKP
jgi:hypothetical protein